jgi:hypothetical protein
MRPSLQPFLSKVAAGKDLTPHLSDLVNKKGVILPGARPADRGKDIDMVLTRQGLHHFHIGISASGNRKGRSGSLVFAEVLEKEFRVVAIADHRAFARGSAEQVRFFQVCHSYMAKDIPPGQAFMANPVMASGHSMFVTFFADRCGDEILRLDTLLDDPAFIDKLYNDQPILRDGKPVARPANPSMAWHFEDLRFGLLDRQTMVFFCIFTYFARLRLVALFSGQRGKIRPHWKPVERFSEGGRYLAHHPLRGLHGQSRSRPAILRARVNRRT